MPLSQFRIRCGSSVVFIVAVSIALLFLLNFRFWRETIALLRPLTWSSVTFLFGTFLAVVFVHAIVLLVIPSRKALKSVAAIFFVVSAAVAYFTDTFGTIINQDVVASVFLTNPSEAAELLTPLLAAYVVFLGIVPAIVIYFVDFPNVGLMQELLHRIVFIVVALLSIGALFYASYAYFAPVRRQKTTRLLNPTATMIAISKYAIGTIFHRATGPADDVSGRVRIVVEARSQKPLLLFLNIGETARAANFQLGGYERATNPQLSKIEDVTYFTNVSSCGTSTGVSVPCMLSHGGRAMFSRHAARQTNLLDALMKGGFSIEWRATNSSVKSVASRIKIIEYAPNSDPILCEHGLCYDELMLKGLQQSLVDAPENKVVVFHHLGSHGPTYWQRYPQRFETFKPTCQTRQLWHCSIEHLVNAYDNTIVYTDHVLAEQIRILQSLSQVFDTAMIYISDHGESLGENGLYLHAFPFGVAPREQTHVPLTMWTSANYRRRFGMDIDCIRSKRERALSHDNIYHTVLGTLGLENDAYKHDLDLMGPCISR